MVTKKANSQGPERSQRTLDNLRAAWDQLAGRYCRDAALIDRFFNEIERKYTSSRRHYHNLQHIQALLTFCEDYAGQLKDADVVAFAVFYHDIIYNVLRKDNEPRSAQLAVKRLQALSVPPERTAHVKLYIEATQTHAVTASVTYTGDLQLFLDFDMSILGAGWSAYEAYTHQVRREYRIYPNKIYYPGRKQFLQHCLQAEHIFQTTVFREQYEAKARENMAQELEAIDAKL
jgi:predicted metal-dependent HD superfamily phosphohydrolase